MVATLACLVCLFGREASPESTVTGFFADLNHHNWKGVFSRYEGAKVDKAVELITKLATPSNAMPKFTFKLGVMTVSGESASGPVKVGMQMHSSQPMYTDDVVRLHRIGGDWKIIEGNSTQSIFTQLSQVARDPSEMLKSSHVAADRTIILSNLKQISLGIIMFTTDNNEKLSFGQAAMKGKLFPYIKNNKVWLKADGKPLDVQLNPNLVGKDLTKIDEPTKCVLLSIGTKSKLEYFGDRTPIAFVDGHVKYMTKAMIATLKWK